ncbi:hypothetical protein [Mycolicibacterium wolinskyi]|uniref:hypothetical protein n=1 Tax=Mycolicibacterium wolinskyi TaxID=59750 RepID=UPI000AC5A950|nr:hypothetical protein [Mycolicibacterium wolinskyi]
MSPAGPSEGSIPTRSQIDNWNTTHLENAAGRWRASATESEELFELQRQNVAAPGGTEWEGTAKDAALDRITRDMSVVRAAGETVRAAADLAATGAGDLRAAQRAALEAIAEAEADEFRVGEDLSVTDTRRVDISTMAARHTAAIEHAENILWNAEQLLQSDKLIGSRLRASAAELESLRFDGEGDGSLPADGIVHAVDFKQWPVFDEDKPWEYNLDLTTGIFLDAPGEPSAGMFQLQLSDGWRTCQDAEGGRSPAS